MAENAPLVDSHCHLNFPDFRKDLDAVVARARENGVVAMQTICTEMSEFEEVAGIASRYDGVFCSVGVHPNDSAKAEIPDLSALLAKTSHPKCIGIGETGLDYHYENSPRAAQQESFRVHIQAAQASGLPLIVHTRDADEDTIAILAEEMAKKPFKGLIHCFSTSQWLAEQAIALGLYVSIAGIVTFKKAVELQEAVKNLPLERLLVETDSPYLAPTPYRGKRNEPAYVRNVAEFIAQLKNVSIEEVARTTTQNFFTLFSKAKKSA